MTKEGWLEREAGRPSMTSKELRCGTGLRLRAVLSECGVSPMDFALIMDINPQSVSNWFVRGVPRKRMDEVARLLSVTQAWLALGHWPKYQVWTQKREVERGMQASAEGMADGPGGR